jgi:hypothetical protein
VGKIALGRHPSRDITAGDFAHPTIAERCNEALPDDRLDGKTQKALELAYPVVI